MARKLIKDAVLKGLPLLMMCSCSVLAGTVGDAVQMQQEQAALKLALEQAKLQKELDVLEAQSSSLARICSSEGIGNLQLKLVYGVNKQLFATFLYNQRTQVEARVGDTLLCGEKVKSISMDYVEVQKGNKTYHISGELTSVPLSTQSTLAAAQQPLVFE